MTVYNERRIIMEKKVHFKLHKVKKHWVTIA
ncbi:KxYKxGKxW signal peptide domain-containing protein, partial [Streptococcus sp. 2.1]|nr:KxYKxGKxW signal peptide domain-containing protein [Streptococcus sp. 2.1]